MLLIDDLLAAPVNGILWVFKEIQKAASEEQRSRRDDIMASLSALYVRLEQGQITEADFDAREQTLLDELDRLDAQDAEDSDEAAAAPADPTPVGSPEPTPEYALKIIAAATDTASSDSPDQLQPTRGPTEDLS